MEFKDMNNREYKIGDIVLNHFFGDYWTVKKYDKDQEVDCLYYLSLYDNDDYYTTDLDTVDSFEIIKSINEEGYNELLEKIRKIGKDLDEEEN